MTNNKPDPLEVSPYVHDASERAQSYAQLGAMLTPKGLYNGNDRYMIEGFAAAPPPRTAPPMPGRAVSWGFWAVVWVALFAAGFILGVMM